MVSKTESPLMELTVKRDRVPDSTVNGCLSSKEQCHSRSERDLRARWEGISEEGEPGTPSSNGSSRGRTILPTGPHKWFSIKVHSAPQGTFYKCTSEASSAAE